MRSLRRLLLVTSLGVWLLETAAMMHEKRYPVSAQCFWRGYHVGFVVGALAVVLAVVVVAGVIA